MFEHFLKKSEELTHKGEPFAVAVVVRDQPPSSGKPGDKAVIDQEGGVHGWIGGGCTRSIVVQEALTAIREGKTRLVRISPKADVEPENGVIDYKMTCHSGGTVEVFIEPVLPKPHIIILGKSSVARALSRLAKAMDYEVSAQAPGADAEIFPSADAITEDFSLADLKLSEQCFVVVSTQGEQDEAAMEAAVKAEPHYLAFVGSRRKANGVFRYLLGNGVDGEKLSQISSPAGLDIGARRPEEIAVSILAEIVQDLRAQREAIQKEDKVALAENLYINPVCNVPVDKNSAKHIIDYKGEKVYFCCDGCKVQFEAEPEKYMSA
ncbi:MAG: XdhC family protein [Bacteroidota bacterium]